MIPPQLTTTEIDNMIAGRWLLYITQCKFVRLAEASTTLDEINDLLDQRLDQQQLDAS